MSDEETARLADAWTFYCLLSNEGKRAFLCMAQSADQKLFKDCVPVLPIERRTGLYDEPI